MSWISAWWNQVSETVADGLQVTVVGMALVFLTLGLVIISLVLLTRLSRPSRASKKEQDVASFSPTEEPAFSGATDVLPTKATTAQDTELAQVAAIAVALLRSRRTRPLRSRAQAETSRWKQYGRAHQLGL